MTLPVVFLMGATAAGKSALALALARELPVDVISVDATQVYRGLDIGSAKPDAATLAEVPHQLVDIREPWETYSAAAFREDAMQAIRRSHAVARVPLLVGGTMLYFKALRDGLAELPSAAPDIRADLQARADRDGWPAMHAWLAQVDPQSASRLQPRDRQRVQRALEVFLSTGTPMSALLLLTPPGLGAAPEYRLLEFAVGPPERRQLDAAIARRFDAMLAEGLVEEVTSLLARPGMTPDLPSMRAVGYRQVAAYVAGRIAFADVREQCLLATRGLAKRQYTWMRKWRALRWLGWHPLNTDGSAARADTADEHDQQRLRAGLHFAVTSVRSVLAASRAGTQR